MKKLSAKLIKEVNQFIFNTPLDIEAVYFEPCKRTITIGTKKHFLPFPYIIIGYYVNSYGDVNPFVLFASNLRNTVFFYPPLPNMGSYGICLGMNQKPDIERIVNRFWNSSFFTYRHYPEKIAELNRIFGGQSVEESLKIWSQIPLNEITKVNFTRLPK